MNRAGCNQKGFTLLELLVALTIFAVGLLGVAGMQLTGLRENATSQARTTAAALATGILEEIRSWPPEAVLLAEDSANNVWSFDDETTIEIAGAGTFQATFDVDTNYNDVTNINRIQVTVTGPGQPVTLVGFRR